MTLPFISPFVTLFNAIELVLLLIIVWLLVNWMRILTLNCGVDNLVTFNQSKTQNLLISCRQDSNMCLIFIWSILFSIRLLPSISLAWTSLTIRLGTLILRLSPQMPPNSWVFVSPELCSERDLVIYFVLGNTLLHLNLFCSRPRLSSMEYGFHIWGGASISTLSVLGRIQRKAIRLKVINHDSLTSSLPPLSHRRSVSSLWLLYRYFHGHCCSYFLPGSSLYLWFFFWSPFSVAYPSPSHQFVCFLPSFLILNEFGMCSLQSPAE